MCTEVRLEKHRMKFHRGGNSGFKCSFCNLKFLTPRKLRKHKKMQHVFTKVFRCHFCEELFTSETDVIFTNFLSFILIIIFLGFKTRTNSYGYN